MSVVTSPAEISRWPVCAGAARHTTAHPTQPRELTRPPATRSHHSQQAKCRRLRSLLVGLGDKGKRTRFLFHALGGTNSTYTRVGSLASANIWLKWRKGLSGTRAGKAIRGHPGPASPDHLVNRGSWACVTAWHPREALPPPASAFHAGRRETAGQASPIQCPLSPS